MRKADFRAGGGSFITVGGSLINFKVRKNDQIRECHRPRIGVPKDSSLDINDQLTDSSVRQASPAQGLH